MRQLIRALVAALVATVLVVPVSTHQIHAAGRSGAAPSGVTLPAGLAPVLQQELTAANGREIDKFGTSVAVSGDTVVVGAVYGGPGPIFNGNGAAYVFVRSGGIWVQQAELTAGDGASNDLFGYAVAVSGDTIVVGAYNKNSAAGAAYIFSRSGGTWSQQQELTVSDGAANDQFGNAVAVSGDTVVIGDGGRTVGANQFQGAAYVFVRNGGAWSQQAELTASDGVTFDAFGLAVAVSGDTVIVSAWGRNTATGAAYVFVRRGNGWSQQAELTAADGVIFDFFGIAVGLSGDTAVISAYEKTVGANQIQGAAYVFVRSGSTWSQQAELTASDGAANDAFGNAVAVSGDTAVIGAFGRTVGANQVQGAAYVFVRSGGTWSQQQDLTASDGATGDEYGFSVAVSGDTAVVGAYSKTVGANQAQGAAYTFKVPSRG
jgi:uncharacterized membrane protein